MEVFLSVDTPVDTITLTGMLLFSEYPFSLMSLRKLSAECEFGKLWDSLIKDTIACGTDDKAILSETSGKM